MVWLSTERARISTWLRVRVLRWLGVQSVVYNTASLSAALEIEHRKQLDDLSSTIAHLHSHHGALIAVLTSRANFQEDVAIRHAIALQGHTEQLVDIQTENKPTVPREIDSAPRRGWQAVREAIEDQEQKQRTA